MQNTDKFSIDNVILVRSSRRSMCIEVKSAKEVIVRAPMKTSLAVIDKFVRQRSAWIEKALERATARENKTPHLSPDEMKKMKREALVYFNERIEYFSDLTSLYPKKISVSVAKKRFGSCSADNKIRLSVYLMFYPKEAIDYVVLHELAHIKHKNHKKQFYALIEKYMPDYKERIKLLRS